MLAGMLQLLLRCVSQVDKLLHLAAGAAIVAVVYLLTKDLAISVSAAVAAGMIKEVYDFLAKNYFNAAHNADVEDIIATIIGAALAAGAIVLL